MIGAERHMAESWLARRCLPFVPSDKARTLHICFSCAPLRFLRDARGIVPLRGRVSTSLRTTTAPPWTRWWPTARRAP